MIHKTRGIVMRVVRYGETSIITTIYTELFGMQSYLLNGVRGGSKKGSSSGNMFQPGAILDLEVYHNELKNLQRIKEYKWGFIYANIFSGVVSTVVAQYIIELTQKSIREPESNTALFHFIEDALIHLDTSEDSVMANFPLYFTLHLMTFLGLQVADAYSEHKTILDLNEGEFTTDKPIHPHFLEGRMSFLSSQLLKVMQPAELKTIPLNQETRRSLLEAYLQFYLIHIPDFGTMKTLGVIRTIF